MTDVTGQTLTDASPPRLQPPKGFGARHMQALILFVCLTIAYTIRAQLSVAMVAMTSNTFQEATKCVKVNNTGIDFADNNCRNELESSPSKWSVYRTYQWHRVTQEMILFSFFVGSTTCMIPMGIISQKYGGKKPLMVALLINGLTSLMVPWIALFTGWMGMCACRLIQGGTQAAFYPCIHTMLGKWAPPCERGRLSTFVYSGSQLGTVLIFQISGLLAGIPALGWPSIFWLCGVLSLVCFGLFSWLGAAYPQDHPTISTEELMYICQECGDMSSKTRRTPWKKILTCSAVWGLVATHAGSAAGLLLVLTETPIYMSEVLGVDRNFLYWSLPDIVMFLTTLGFGYISDMLVTRKVMTIRNVRRTCNSIGMVISGIFLVAFGYVQNVVLAVILMILCLGLHSGVQTGFHINQIDLAPNFAGPIMALGNMLANLTSLLVPVMVANVVKDDLSNQHRWQIVFIIIFAFQFLTNTVFVIFAQGTVQPWNYAHEETTNVPDDVSDLINLQEKQLSLLKEDKNGKLEN